MKTLKERTQEAIDAGHTVGDLARAAGTTPAAVSHWRSGHTKSIKGSSAAGLESLTGWSATWWATGLGPRSRGQAQPLSLSVATVPHLTWEDLMMGRLPEQFSLDCQDDSMSPRLSAGGRVTMQTGIAPRPGDCVLVRDAGGNRYLRIYRPRTASSWDAQPLNQAYGSLDSERDGLQVEAVLVATHARWG